MIHGDSGLSGAAVHRAAGSTEADQQHCRQRDHRCQHPRRRGGEQHHLGVVRNHRREPRGSGPCVPSVCGRPARWHAGVVHELIALLMPGGDDIVAAVQRSWDAGDAVLPLDPTAPRAHLDRVIAELAPTMVVEADGEAAHARATDDRSRRATRS